MDSLQLVKMFYLALVSSFIIVQIHCDTNQSDTWDSISSDFQLGIPNLNKPLTESTKTRIESTTDRKETDYVKKQTEVITDKTDQFDKWDDLTDSDLIIPDPMAVRSLLKPVDEKAFSVSQSFMEGKPENQQPKTTLRSLY
uniref:Uncharacterized protein n=1 Tax=Tetranychus urticae TaxID=32264 RepID=T1KAJ6_TETUR